MTENDLKSINDFDKYTKFISQFILENTTLWKLIFYPYSSPLTDQRAIDPKDPYQIFTRDIITNENGTSSDSHGVVLFEDKDDSIQNSTGITVLVHYESTRLGDSYFLDTNHIIFQVICKGDDIRKLSNGKDRVESIFELIDNEFNFARVNNIGEVHKITYEKLSLNDGNTGRVGIYKCIGWSSKLTNNKNYLKRKYGSPDGK
jgi:hypothetical protein